jgi:hypothetical protein
VRETDGESDAMAPDVLELLIRVYSCSIEPIRLGSPRHPPEARQFEFCVPIAIFSPFVSVLEGSTIEISQSNWVDLSTLCDESGFPDLSARLSQSFPARILALDEVILTQSREIASHQTKTFTAHGIIARFAQRQHFRGIRAAGMGGA